MTLAHQLIRTLRTRLRGEHGEGVISTGIVVLIMALIGAAMWVTFSTVIDDTGEKVEDEVGKIGSNED